MAQTRKILEANSNVTETLREAMRHVSAHLKEAVADKKQQKLSKADTRAVQENYRAWLQTTGEDNE